MPEWEEEDITHLAKLCRIKCSEEEKGIFKKNLHQMLAYVELLQEVDTGETIPCNHVLETMISVMRDDEEKPEGLKGAFRKDFLNNAPDQIAGMVKIPPVIQFEE